MSKYYSAKYYRDSKERLRKKAREGYQSLSKEEKEKRQYRREGYKISLKMKSKGWLSMEKSIIK